MDAMAEFQVFREIESAEKETAWAIPCGPQHDFAAHSLLESIAGMSQSRARSNSFHHLCMQHCVTYKFSHSVSLDESLLADIDAYLALHNQVQLAAAHNSAEDDSDDIMGLRMWMMMDIVAETQALGHRTRAGDIGSPASNTKEMHILWTPTQASTYSLLTPFHDRLLAGWSDAYGSRNSALAAFFAISRRRSRAASLIGGQGSAVIGEAALGVIDESLLLMPRGSGNR
ncbi:hypothetical protein GB937_002692 [Aspergillus fischeri]|nr:hypothetical protein GB937_002692 [Aspergillus fischeri]